MKNNTPRYTQIPGQLRQLTTSTEPTRRPDDIPRESWPEDPRAAVPEVLYDETGAELPRYRATADCYTQVEVDGGRYVAVVPPNLAKKDDEGYAQEFYHVGPPGPHMEPVNEAALDAAARYPSAPASDPIELLPI